MCIVSFRPHYLRVLVFSQGYYDSAGTWHEGVETASRDIACRYEPNGGKARVVPIGEGKNAEYSYTVYLNTDCPEIPFGTRLELFDQNHESIGIYSSLGFHRGQLDAKLWV
jgi:hypothetical protein